MKLNLGCGSNVVNGWTNVDYAFGARIAKFPIFRILNRNQRLLNLNWNRNILIHNLTKTFPWNDCSVAIIYSSHSLEHFTKGDGRQLLEECHRVLRKDGIIRIIVPNLRGIIDDYIEGRLPADDFINRLGVLFIKRNSALKNRLAPFFQYPHKCMYDKPRLLEILNEIGFDASSRSAFDSDISDIHQIELEKRTENNALIVEGRKI